MIGQALESTPFEQSTEWALNIFFLLLLVAWWCYDSPRIYLTSLATRSHLFWSWCLHSPKINRAGRRKNLRKGFKNIEPQNLMIFLSTLQSLLFGEKEVFSNAPCSLPLSSPSTLHVPLITDSFNGLCLNSVSVLQAGRMKSNKMQALLSKSS